LQTVQYHISPSLRLPLTVVVIKPPERFMVVIVMRVVSSSGKNDSAVQPNEF
jgi:hypothetical protein